MPCFSYSKLATEQMQAFLPFPSVFLIYLAQCGPPRVLHAHVRYESYAAADLSDMTPLSLPVGALALAPSIAVPPKRCRCGSGHGTSSCAPSAWPARPRILFNELIIVSEPEQGTADPRCVGGGGPQPCCASPTGPCAMKPLPRCLALQIKLRTISRRVC